MSCLKLTTNGVTVNATKRGETDLFSAIWRLKELGAISESKYRAIQTQITTTRFDREILEILQAEIPELEIHSCASCSCGN